MVEGHSVHRVAAFHRQRLIGKAFDAISPNGRFTDGARAINGKVFERIEAVGKNLFCFFGSEPTVVVVHVHFGMAGSWSVYENSKEEEPVPPPPAPTATTRLRLQGHNLTADLSAMTVQHGTMELYESKRAKLGQDPLRDDANPELLWDMVRSSKKSIGALIMDQRYFTGPGNIYRAEILFKAAVHPDTPGNELSRQQFDRVWYHTVDLLQRGFQTGSILTVDDPDDKAIIGLSLSGRRRYIYNSATCPRCGSSIRTCPINNRTCYACPKCQPRTATAASSAAAAANNETKDCIPFHSHCARESVETRLQEPHRLTVKEIKHELSKRGQIIPTKAKKKELVALLLQQQVCLRRNNDNDNKTKIVVVSSEAAAAEKAAAGESLAVEHTAELAPRQARRARARVVQHRNDDDDKDTSITTTTTKPTKRRRSREVSPRASSTESSVQIIKTHHHNKVASAATTVRYIHHQQEAATATTPKRRRCRSTTTKPPRATSAAKNITP